tara:strand:- start:191 stop:406 length:216 start_codon:yes stop_codon:yes gene_type:complete
MQNELSHLKSMFSSGLSISVGLMQFIDALSPLLGLLAICVGLAGGVRAYQVKTIEKKLKEIELDKLKKNNE